MEQEIEEVEALDAYETDEKILILTPIGDFNPDDSAYAKNESSMLDYEGNMVEKQYRKQILLSELPEDNPMIPEHKISSV